MVPEMHAITDSYHEIVNVSSYDNDSAATSNSYHNTTPHPHRPERPSALVEQTVIFFSIAGSTIGVLSIVLNTIFLGTLMRLVKCGGGGGGGSTRTTYMRYIHNLAVADVLAAASFLITQHWPAWMYSYIDPEHHLMLVHGVAYVFRGTPWMFFTVYYLTLCCLTFNQYVAVCQPWRYSQMMVSRTVTVSLVVIWLVGSLQVVVPAVVIAVLSSVPDKREAMAMLYTFAEFEMHWWLAVLAASIFFNIVLDSIAYRKIHRLKLKMRFCSSSVDRKNLGIKQEAFITLSLLLAASFFCRLPTPVFGILGLNIKYSMSASAKELIESFLVFLLYSNFMLDPVIVMVRTLEMKRQCKRTFNNCRVMFKHCSRSYSEETSGPESINLVNYRKHQKSTRDLVTFSCTTSRKPI